MTKPTAFVVTLVAIPHVDADRAIRALLKRALRTYGLRCIAIKQEPISNSTQEAA